MRTRNPPSVLSLKEKEETRFPFTTTGVQKEKVGISSEEDATFG
jgi:hypothetical protein